MYMDAFHQWKALHDHYLKSTKDYLAACLALETTLSTPLNLHSSRSELESSLLLVNEELPAISAGGKQLQEAASCLSRLRNRSTTLAPINLLPTELLSSIFCTINDLDTLCLLGVRDNKPFRATSLDSITSVRSSWRQIAITTPELWSHVDIVGAGYWKKRTMARAQRRIRRVSSAPLTMHIQDTLGISAGLSDADISYVVALVAPHMEKLQTLSVSLDSPDWRLAVDVLRCLVVGPSIPRALLALDISNRQGRYTETPIDVLSTCPSQSQFLALASVHFLTLRSTYISWDSAVYFDLVDLNIEGLSKRVWPTMEQITSVLSSSPRLRRLRLRKLGIVWDESSGVLNRVFLGELEELNLLDLSEGLCWILGPMTVGPKLSSASIELHSTLDELAVRFFFLRSPVVTLYVKDDRFVFGERQRALRLFESLPRLQHLALELHDISYKTLAAHLESWPQLHTLHIVRSVVDSFPVPPTFNSNRNLRLLAMWECCVERCQPWMDRSQLRLSEIVSQLREVVPKVTRNKEREECPAHHWPGAM
ncbi:hypothetical protein BDV93DRAFT_547312 [Ceratobasidium sp. AG-I]|nr:hypothetical protein BDV93DRAFT_547312 [Ceratobasidium sp. AG-I]